MARVFSMIAPHRQVGFRALVRQECANLDGERCLVGEQPCPVLLAPPERCNCGVGPFGGKTRVPYFEKAVLPLAKKRPQYADAPAEYFKAMERAARRKDHPPELEVVALRDRAAAEASSAARCPACGGPRERRRRYCPACRTQRRRETKRRAQAAWRKRRV